MAAGVGNEILIFRHDSQVKRGQVTEVTQFFDQKSLGKSFVLLVTLLQYADGVLFKVTSRKRMRSVNFKKLYKFTSKNAVFLLSTLLTIYSVADSEQLCRVRSFKMTAAKCPLQR